MKRKKRAAILAANYATILWQSREIDRRNIEITRGLADVQKMVTAMNNPPAILDSAFAQETSARIQHRLLNWDPFLHGNPGIIRKGASDYADPNPVENEHVAKLLRLNFPESAIKWALDPQTRWIGPVRVPLDRIDFDDEDSWQARKDHALVDQFARQMKDGSAHLHPIIMVQKERKNTLVVEDGHHRLEAAKKLGIRPLAYIAFIPKRLEQQADEMHSSQYHSGGSPQNKDSHGWPTEWQMLYKTNGYGHERVVRREHPQTWHPES